MRKAGWGGRCSGELSRRKPRVGFAGGSPPQLSSSSVPLSLMDGMGLARHGLSVLGSQTSKPVVVTRHGPGSSFSSTRYPDCLNNKGVTEKTRAKSK